MQLASSGCHSYSLPRTSTEITKEHKNVQRKECWETAKRTISRPETLRALWTVCRGWGGVHRKTDSFRRGSTFPTQSCQVLELKAAWRQGCAKGTFSGGQKERTAVTAQGPHSHPQLPVGCTAGWVREDLPDSLPTSTGRMRGGVGGGRGPVSKTA